MWHVTNLITPRSSIISIINIFFNPGPTFPSNLTEIAPFRLAWFSTATSKTPTRSCGAVLYKLWYTDSRHAIIFNQVSLFIFLFALY
ncbi:unnamed protein product, partial [Psylliodes chrysocephalus]